MSGRGWKEEEIQYLLENDAKMRRKDIAKVLGRSHGCIDVKAKALGLAKRHAWTEDEVDFLKNNYKKYTNAELAIHLGKTDGNLRSIAWKMGLRKKWDNVTTKCNKALIQANEEKKRNAQKALGTSASRINQLYNTHI